MAFEAAYWANSSLTGYIMEIAGFTSSTGDKQYNQNLGEGQMK